MANPNLLLHLAYNIIGAPNREHAGHIFAQMCLQDMAAAARLAEFLVYVIPDSVDLWGGILKGIAEHQAEQAQQSTPQPFLWTDADSADTAESIDAHLHEGGDHGPATQ